MWRFSDLRAYLLPLAEKVLGDADKIAFSREFDLHDWLAPAHVRLCQRQEPLTLKEATKLGTRSLLMISSIREEFPPKQGSTQATSCTGYRYHNGYGYNTGHCPTCALQLTSNANRPTPESIAQIIEERVRKWIENGCEFPE